MTMRRTDVLAGLACGLPVALWVFGEYAASGGAAVETRAPVLQIVQALWLCQALALTLTVPLDPDATSLGERVVGGCLQILVPLPVLCVIWLTGSVPWGLLARAGLVLGTYAALLAGATYGIDRHMRPCSLHYSAANLARLFGATGIWATRTQWLPWLGA